MLKTRICELLNLDFPIIQGGMVWVSGHKLVSAVSNAGGLGVLSGGSMKPELLKEHILQVKAKTQKPFAINLPLIYSDVEKQVDIALKHGVDIFITSAGSPKKYTKFLQERGAKVLHVTSTLELAKKCEQAGVDAVILEGHEAGGHNGRDELTTFTLIPQAAKELSIPFIAAGGIATGEGILAALALGAHGVQMGTRFLMTQESSAHRNFKNLALKASSTSTQLLMKNLIPVRLLDNLFAKKVQELEAKQASKEEIITLLGKGRAKAGMLEGDIKEGELEIGQIISLIEDIPTVKELFENLKQEFDHRRQFLCR